MISKNPNRISIALATFNGSRYLGQQLDSLARQRLLPSEVVISDDRSTDETLAIVQEFAQRAPFPVRQTVNSDHLGFADNFLHAASLCEGQFIAFCDQDDVWREDKLEVCIELFNSSDVTLVGHPVEEVTRDLKPLHRWFPDARTPYVLNKNERNLSDPEQGFVLGCAMVVRRAVADEVLRRWPPLHLRYLRHGQFSQLLGHDSSCFFTARGLGTVKYVPEPLVLHRLHESNTWSVQITTFKDELRSTARTGAGYYRQRAEAAQAQAELYMLLGAESDQVGTVFRNIAHRCQIESHAFGARAQLYQSPSRRERARILTNMIISGFYGGGPRLLRTRAMLKDSFVAVTGFWND